MSTREMTRDDDDDYDDDDGNKDDVHLHSDIRVTHTCSVNSLPVTWTRSQRVIIVINFSTNLCDLYNERRTDMSLC